MVRHGESELNLLGLHQKPTTPLSKTGQKQARILAKRFTKIPIDLIYASPLLRTKQTAQIINKMLKIPIEYREELREKVRATSLQGKGPGKGIPKKLYKLLRKHRYDPDWSYEDSESFNQLAQRVYKTIKHLEKDHEKQNLLVITHGIFMRMFLGITFLGKEISPREFYAIADKLVTHNTGISVLDYNKGEGWTLISWNDTAHLGKLPTAKEPKELLTHL